MELDIPAEILAVSFSLPFFVLTLAFLRDVFPSQQEDDVRSTRLVYEKYLGIQGRYYVSKVAILQIAAVFLQGLGKLRPFGALVTVRDVLGYGGFSLWHGGGQEMPCYWVFIGSSDLLWTVGVFCVVSPVETYLELN